MKIGIAFPTKNRGPYHMPSHSFQILKAEEYFFNVSLYISKKNGEWKIITCMLQVSKYLPRDNKFSCGVGAVKESANGKRKPPDLPIK